LEQPITEETSSLIAALATAGWRLGKASDAWNAMQRVSLITTLTRVTYDRAVDRAVIAVAFSPDGQFLATASFDKTARLVAVADGRERARITHDARVWAVAFSPDGRLLATASAETARLVAVADGRERARITHDGKVNAVAFSPDGQVLATASSDKTARLVAVADGRERARITHDSVVSRVAFSPDGQFLATASGDLTETKGEARLVAMADGHERARITHDGAVWAVAFSPDGQFLATASEDGTARIWSTALDDMLHQLCTGHGRNLSPGEWRRYLGDLPWQPTCESWPTPKD
jgi:WD40 repeat protein